MAVPDDAPDLGHAGRSPAFDPAVEIRAAADVNAQATEAHAIMWAVPWLVRASARGASADLPGGTSGQALRYS